jgi:hypothetical protein
MCSAAHSVQRLGAGFGAGAENDDDAKRIYYASKSGKFLATLEDLGSAVRLPWVVLLLRYRRSCGWTCASSQSNAGEDAMSG